MMLNTDVAMVFKQNNAMAECKSKALADAGGNKRKAMGARKKC